MCGINGIAYSDSRTVDEKVLAQMRDCLSHRGPNDAGVFTAPGIGLGSRRLSIIDLSEKGRMPMKTSDGRFWIVYNGEIFNFQELRKELIAKGERFQSNTDTEVVLNLYAAEGPAMLERLNGMFAFAIWDTREKTLFLARDPLGIKPLYYLSNPDAFYFASEAKAFSALGIPPEFDPNTLEELLCFRYVAGERTCFKNIKRILPGHYLIWKNGKIQMRRWWNLGERVQSQSENDSPEKFLALFDESVKLRTISDVPLGVFLSGGLDSNAVAASLASQTKEQVKTFMIRFKNPAYDEGPLAQQTVARWHFDHHEIYGESGDLLSELRQSSWFNDEPLAHGNDFYFYMLSRYAKSKATVLLSGEGADEILGGYVRYLPLRYPHLLKGMQPWLPALRPFLKSIPRLKKTADFLKMGGLDSFILYNACNVLPYQLESFGMQTRGASDYRKEKLVEAKKYSSEPLRQAMYLDQHTFLGSLLDRNDRMTMGASIECRPPFLDHRLVEMAAKIPTSALFKNNRGKAILRRAVKDRLPQAVLNHRKWGFGVPWEQFLREDPKLREYVTLLPDKEPFLSGSLDRGKLKECIAGFLQGSNEFYALILEMMMIALWYEVFFSGKHSPKDYSSILS